MINRLLKNRLIVLGTVLSIGLFSCEKEDETGIEPVQVSNIVRTASADENFSILVEALTKANLAGTLETGGPFTVFAPTNDAFESFLTEKGFNSLNDVPVDALTSILLNHVVAGDVRSTDLTQGYVSTLGKESTTNNPYSLYVDLANGVLLNGISKVINPDVKALNGVIHAVDAVIDVPTVVTHAASNADFSILVSALTRSDLTIDYISVLSGNGPFTVFAPTNDAFQALLNSNPDWNTLQDIPVDVLQTVLNYHVVAGANVLASNLRDGMTVNALSQEAFTINLLSNSASITDGTGMDAKIIAVNVQAGNGVIHVIDKVILPPSVASPAMSIVDIAAGNSNFTSLVSALSKADLVTALQGEGPFTVFAPTNEAFAAFLARKGFSSLDEVPVNVLTTVLLNHVVAGRVESGDLTKGYVSTLASETTTGNNLSLYVDLSSGVKLNGSSSVTKADIDASNGVIHVIDAVIDVPSVVTHALANASFNILVAALTRGDLSTDFVSVLSGTGPFTVFAPTNAAFEDLLASNPEWSSLSDIPAATMETVLKYHVVSGANVLSSSLTNGQQVTALSGDTFTVNISSSGASLTDENNGTANILAVDVQAGNGVIHVIDYVILPQ